MAPKMKKPGTSRIILVNGPRLLHEIIKTAISQEPGLEIVADIDNPLYFNQAVNKVEADWTYLLLQPTGEIPSLILEFVQHEGNMRLMVMSADGSLVRVQGPEVPLHDLRALDSHDIFDLLHLQGTKYSPEIS